MFRCQSWGLLVIFWEPNTFKLLFNELKFEKAIIWKVFEDYILPSTTWVDDVTDD